MEYMLAFHETAEEFAKLDDPAQKDVYWGAWMAYVGAIQEAGVVVSGNGLQPPETGTMVRVNGDTRDVHDGPYPDTKERLGGYFTINVPDLDTALDWAAKAPAAKAGFVEVRPVLPPPSDM